MTTLDMTPTWEEAVTIYIEVLRNPDAPFSAVQAAKEEIIRLAQMVDKRLMRKEP